MTIFLFHHLAFDYRRYWAIANSDPHDHGEASYHRQSP
jgi:hypothetical protein